MSNVHAADIELDPAGVATLWLDQPGRPVVVLDRALIEGIDAALDGLPGGVSGFVLASRSTRVFVAGADLVEIDGLGDAELDAYLSLGQRVFGRIAELPCTTVAAVTGATLGGGLEIAMHCDELVALDPGETGKPYLVGLPEAGLGLCPGWGGANMLPSRMNAAEAIGLTAAGTPLKIGAMIEAGLFAATAPTREDVFDLARQRARAPKAARGGDGPRNISWNTEDAQAGLEAAQIPATPAGAGVRACVEAGLSGGWASGLETEKKTLISLRGTPEARGALAAFFSKTTSRASDAGRTRSSR